MQITWFNDKPKDLIVTLAPGTITLNKPASLYFETAYRVLLGYNKTDSSVFIKPLNKEIAQRHDMPDNHRYKITVKSSYARVANKAFVDEVVEMLSIDLDEQSKKFKASWHEKEQLLVVNLKERV